MSSTASVAESNTVNLAWDLQEARGDVHQEAYAKAMREGMAKVCKEHGGPENFLRVRFQAQEQLRDWLNYLLFLIPYDSAGFNFSDDLPSTSMDSVRQAGAVYGTHTFS